MDNNILTKNRQLRNDKLNNVNNNWIKEILLKVLGYTLPEVRYQSMVYHTISDISKLYGVAEVTVRNLYNANTEEFSADGVKFLDSSEVNLCARGNSAQIVNSKARNLLLFRPKAALRVGFFLTKSQKAKNLRNYFLMEEEKRQNKKEKEKKYRPTATLSLRLPEETKNKVEKCSQKLQLTKSQAILTMVHEYFENHPEYADDENHEEENFEPNEINLEDFLTEEDKKEINKIIEEENWQITFEQAHKIYKQKRE